LNPLRFLEGLPFRSSWCPSFTPASFPPQDHLRHNSLASFLSVLPLPQSTTGSHPPSTPSPFVLSWPGRELLPWLSSRQRTVSFPPRSFAQLLRSLPLFLLFQWLSCGLCLRYESRPSFGWRGRCLHSSSPVFSFGLPCLFFFLETGDSF